MKQTLLLLLCLGACSPDAPAPKPPAPPTDVAAAKAPEAAETKLPPSFTGKAIPFTAPAGWTSEEPSNRLRVAQYKVPDKAKKAADAEFVLSTTRLWNEDMRQENIARWGRQMGVDAPKAELLQGKFKITLVDLSGTYKSDFEPEPIEQARMLVAAVETGEAPWFFKLIGPAETVSGWRDEFVAMLKAAGP